MVLLIGLLYLSTTVLASQKFAQVDIMQMLTAPLGFPNDITDLKEQKGTGAKKLQWTRLREAVDARIALELIAKEQKGLEVNVPIGKYFTGEHQEMLALPWGGKQWYPELLNQLRQYRSDWIHAKEQQKFLAKMKEQTGGIRVGAQQELAKQIKLLQSQISKLQQKGRSFVESEVRKRTQDLIKLLEIVELVRPSEPQERTLLVWLKIIDKELTRQSNFLQATKIPRHISTLIVPTNLIVPDRKTKTRFQNNLLRARLTWRLAIKPWIEERKKFFKNISLGEVDAMLDKVDEEIYQDEEQFVFLFNTILGGTKHPTEINPVARKWNVLPTLFSYLSQYFNQNPDQLSAAKVKKSWGGVHGQKTFFHMFRRFYISLYAASRLASSNLKNIQLRTDSSEERYKPREKSKHELREWEGGDMYYKIVFENNIKNAQDILNGLLGGIRDQYTIEAVQNDITLVSGNDIKTAKIGAYRAYLSTLLIDDQLNFIKLKLTNWKKGYTGQVVYNKAKEIKAREEMEKAVIIYMAEQESLFKAVERIHTVQTAQLEGLRDVWFALSLVNRPEKGQRSSRQYQRYVGFITSGLRKSTKITL